MRAHKWPLDETVGARGESAEGVEDEHTAPREGVRRSPEILRETSVRDGPERYRGYDPAPRPPRPPPQLFSSPRSRPGAPAEPDGGSPTNQHTFTATPSRENSPRPFHHHTPAHARAHTRIPTYINV